MTMKNSTETVGGIFQKSTLVESWAGNPLTYSSQNSFTDSKQTLRVKTIGSVTSVSGDFKKTNPHNFVVSRVENMAGTTFTVTRSPATPSNGPHSVTTVNASGPTGEGPAGVTLPVSNYAALAYNACLAKAFDQLRGSVDLSVSIAEGGQVARMFRAASKLDRYVRRWNWKEISNTWLEFTYGWRPLAQDLHGSIEQLRSRVNSAVFIEAQATQRDRKDSNGTAGYYNTIIGETVSARCKLKFTYMPTNSGLDQVSRLTSLNPVSIAWELMPYSFVVDWFVDIGGFIRDLETSLTSVGPVEGWLVKTTKVEVTTVRSGIGKHATLPNNGVTVSGVLTGKYSSVTYNRARLTAMPIPGRPRFKANLGASRLLSAAALLSQFVKGEPQKFRVMPRATDPRFATAKKRAARASQVPSNWGLSHKR